MNYTVTTSMEKELATIVVKAFAEEMPKNCLSLCVNGEEHTRSIPENSIEHFVKFSTLAGLGKGFKVVLSAYSVENNNGLVCAERI